MSKKEELNKLFEEWKEEQKINSIENTETIQIQIKFKRVEKDSFSIDGFVNEEKSGTILYILAETDLQDSVCVDNNYFWFKDVYKNESNNSIPKRIRKMQEVIHKYRNDIGLDDISYMNINKRGGYYPCDYAVLQKYYNKYKKFIWKEISIIEPKTVVFCAGKDSINIYNDLVKNKDKYNCENILFIAHPSCRYSDDKYIEEFEKEVERIYGTEF